MAKVHRQMQLGFLVVPTGLGIQLITMLLIASHLGPGRFGIYSVIMGIVNVALFVISMGLGTNLTKLVAEGRQSASYYVALSLPLVSVFAAAAGLVLIIISWAAYSIETAGWAALVAALNILCFGPASVFSAALNGLQQVEKWMVWFLGHKIVGLVVVLALLRPLHGGLGLALASATIANLVMMFYAGAALWGEAWRGQMRWNLKEVRGLIGGSFTIALTAAVTRLAMELDTFVLALLMPDHVVGTYSAGKRLINPAGQILNGAVSVPTFPGLCRLVGENRAEFTRWTSRLCSIQWIAGLAMALVAWAAAPYVIPRVLKGDFTDTVGVIQITVWSLVPFLMANQLRYSYIALARENRFVSLNIAYLVLKALILGLLTWRYGIWGACWGAVLAELVLAVLVWVGISSADLRIPFDWPGALATAATAVCLGLLWLLGDHQRVLFAGLATAYFVAAVYVVNRMLRTVREHIPRPARRGGPAVGDAPAA